MQVRQGGAVRASRHFSIAAFAAALLALSAASASPAQAQTRADQELLLRSSLAQPANHELTFQYARVSTALGDYEAAIGALERLLFFNPTMSRVKYELGALYFRLRSYEIASRYFQDALASPDLDPLTRSRIEAALPTVQKQREPHRLSAFFQTGLRYQTNANASPASGVVRFGATEFELPPESRRKADWNAFILGGVSYDIDLQNQRGDVIETRVLGYGTHQFRLDELNVGFVEASFGPRLALAPDLFPGVTVKPYAVASYATVDGDTFGSYGAGVSLGIPVMPDWQVDPFVEWRRSDVDRSPALAGLSSVGSGESVTIGWSSSYRIREGLALQTRSAYRDSEGRQPWQSSEQMLSEAALTFEFDPLWASIPRRWSLTPYVRYTQTEYDAANPAIDAGIRRKDREWRTGLVFDAPITRWLGVSASVSYSQVESNLRNYDTDNFSFLIGPTAQF